MTDPVRTAPARRQRVRAVVRRWLAGRLRGGAVRPVRRIGAPFRPVLAHHRGPHLLTGHGDAFREATAVQGVQPSSYFRESGISACAEANGGMCSFRMGRKLAVYQITNSPLLNDDVLAPSTDTNRELFGDFMGSLPNAHPGRPAKRAVVERIFGNARFIEQLAPFIREHAANHLAEMSGHELPLDDFALSLVAHVDSMVPGVLDLTQQPLSTYLAKPEYGRVMRSFFEIASDVISRLDRDAMSEFDMIVPFVRDVLLRNAEAIAAAPESNLIRQYFTLWQHPFTRAGIEHLDTAKVKELGTLIVATYDTTALSLLWALGYLETSPEQKRGVVAEARNGSHGAGTGHGGDDGTDGGDGGGRLSEIDLAVLEAVRLGGSNPTALWRRTTAPFVLRRGRHRAVIPAGTMMWLDRRQANRNPAVFPRPDRFDVANVRAIVRSERETLSSLLSRSRYEINSFSMINSDRNPRKCPGRLFSVRVQSMLLTEIYSRYDVSAHGIDLRLKDRSSMPRPQRPGTVRITEWRSARDERRNT